MKLKMKFFSVIMVFSLLITSFSTGIFQTVYGAGSTNSTENSTKSAISKKAPANRLTVKDAVILFIVATVGGTILGTCSGFLSDYSYNCKLEDGKLKISNIKAPLAGKGAKVGAGLGALVWVAALALTV